MPHEVQVASQYGLSLLPVLHSVRISSVEVKACDGGRSVHVQFPGHSVQVGQLQVDAAHGQHAGFEQVDVAVIVTGNLMETRARGSAIFPAHKHFH